MKKIDSGLHYPLDMNTLSKTWSVSYIGDVAIEIQPGFASGEHNQEGTGIPHVRPMNINRQGNLDLSVVKYVSPDKDKKRLRAGDVLFNNTNSPELIGKTTVINKDIDWAFSNHMTRIVFPQEVSPKFVAYQLHFLWSMGYFLHKCVKHVNQASISSKTLGDSVPLILAPFNEQKLIVSEIEKQFSRLDEAVAALKRVRASLKRYKAAVLKAAVEGKLTEEKVKWNETTFGEIISISSGDGLTKTQRNDEGEYLVYGGNGIAGRHSEFMYEEEKLIIGRVGVHCGNAHTTKPKSWITDNAFVVSFDKKSIDIKFLFHLIWFLNLNKYSSSTAQPVISQGKLYPIEISIPEKKEEQQKIVEEIESRLSVAEEVEEAIDINLKRSERLRQAILKKAFSGRLVPQEHNKETAGELTR
ncbi:MAG: restriction endonuclease subunit S [Nitrospirota bacterium]